MKLIFSDCLSVTYSARSRRQYSKKPCMASEHCNEICYTDDMYSSVLYLMLLPLVK